MVEIFRTRVNITRYMAVAIVLAVMMLLVLPASGVGAMGLGIGPSMIEISDALRGGEYERTIRIFNPDKAEIDVVLGVEGEIGEWTSFYHENDYSAQIEAISFTGQEYMSVVVKFNIPEDVASGTYTGTVYAELNPDEEVVGTGVTTKLRMPSKVTIEVTGDQVVSGVVTAIEAEDTEINHPVRIKVGFRNTGNVVVKPGIKVEISSGGVLVGEVSYEEATIKPGSQETIVVEWDTVGQDVGDYLASVEVFLGDEMIGSGDTMFALLPEGTLTRAGILKEISLKGGSVVGSLVAVVAEFANTGQIDTRARFSCEVYLGGELIEALESEEVLVAVGEIEELQSYLRLEKAGQYEIRGYVNYEGKKTEVKAFSFTATSEVVGTISGYKETETETETEANQEPFNLWPPIIGGILGALVLGIIVILTVPWPKLQLARKVLIAQWPRLKLVYKNITMRWRRLLLTWKLSIWGSLHK